MTNSVTAHRAASAALQLLQARQERGPGQHQGRRRVATRRGGRGDCVRGARAGAGRRADVHGGHRAQPGPEQQPAGVDHPGGLRPHLVALHRLHLRSRRGRVRWTVPLRSIPSLLSIIWNLDVNSLVMGVISDMAICI
jgi:hypothetical protein